MIRRSGARTAQSKSSYCALKDKYEAQVNDLQRKYDNERENIRATQAVIDGLRKDIAQLKGDSEQTKHFHNAEIAEYKRTISTLKEALRTAIENSATVEERVSEEIRRWIHVNASIT